MTPLPRGRQFTRWAPAVGILLLILAATLGRTELAPPGVRHVDRCFTCGSQWGIDFVLNIALFVPLGLSLRVAGARRGAAFAALLAVTLAIELVQLAIPGRVSSTGDLLANTIGGLLGHELGAWLRVFAAPAARQAVWLAGAAGAFVPAMLAASLWLFHPLPTAHPYWGQFAPTLGQFAQFHGEVLEASVGDEPLRNGRLPNTDRVRAALRRPVITARATVLPGAASEALAPAVSIFDGEHNEILLLGRHHDDLVFRVRSRAMRLGFRTPSVTVWNAFRVGQRTGAMPLQLTGRVDGYTISAEARADTACASRAIDFRPTQGWAYLLPFEHLYMPHAPRYTLVWLALLFAPLGYYAAFAGARHHRVAARLGVIAWIAAVMVFSLVAIPAAAGLTSGTPAEWRGAGLGIGAGALAALAVAALLRLGSASRRTPPDAP